MNSFKEPEYGWPRYEDFYITLITGGISFALNKLLNLITWNFFYNNCKEKDDQYVRMAKTKKAANSFYKFLYFASVACWGYSILKDEDYLPVTLLGKGSLSNLNKSYPVHKWPKGLKYYYLGTMGYHVH